MTTTADIIDRHRLSHRWVGHGVTIKCTCGHESQARIGTGPFDSENNSHRDAERMHAQHIADAITDYAPLTTDSPDLADGGVTCAAIEKEWDFFSGAGSVFPSPAKGMRYQRERDEARAMAALWKETARKLARESRNAHDWAERVETSIADVAARAEKAEQERDKAATMRDRWKATANSADDVIRAVLRELGAGPETEPVTKAKAVREARDAWREVAKRKSAEHPRPLSPDDVDDEMVARAVQAWKKVTGVMPYAGTVCVALRAALAVPQRPEGAEDIEIALAGFVDNGDGDLRVKVSDWLASRGVRVTGAES